MGVTFNFDESRNKRINKLRLSCAKLRSSLASKDRPYVIVLVVRMLPPWGWGGWLVGEMRNKTKLQPSSVELKLELGLSLAIIISEKKTKAMIYKLTQNHQFTKRKETTHL